MSFEKISSNTQNKEHLETGSVNGASHSDSTDAVPQDDDFVPFEAANDPVYQVEVPVSAMSWPNGIPYDVVVPEAEIVIGDVVGETSIVPEQTTGGTTMRPPVTRAVQLEVTEMPAASAGFFGRLKNWFSNMKQDQRTLEDILIEQGGYQKKERVVAQSHYGEMIDTNQPFIEEITLDETTVPKGQLTENERRQIEALRIVSSLHNQTDPERSRKSFLGKVKSWFTSGRENNFTLEQRLAATEGEDTLAQIRRKLALKPDSLKPEEILKLNKREKDYYLNYHSRLEIEKRVKLNAAKEKLAADPALLTEAEVELLGVHQKAYYDRWKNSHS